MKKEPPERERHGSEDSFLRPRAPSEVFRVLLLQLGQLATLLFTTAAAYQLTDRYKA